MKRFTLVCALLLCTIVALGAVISRAAAPGTVAAHPPRPGGKEQPLEGGPAVKPGPFLTGPPSAHVAIDPHWRANVRANTDTTGTQYAQQEPAIAVNPLNPLNVVVAQKDERSAPAPN